MKGITALRRKSCVRLVYYAQQKAPIRSGASQLCSAATLVAKFRQTRVSPTPRPCCSPSRQLSWVYTRRATLNCRLLKCSGKQLTRLSSSGADHLAGRIRVWPRWSKRSRHGGVGEGLSRTFASPGGGWQGTRSHPKGDEREQEKSELCQGNCQIVIQV